MSAQSRSRAPSRFRGFTIVELLVVVSIIALLVGILLPAIGRAQDQARLTKSQAQMKQMGTAHVTYAAEYNDRQLTFINDNISQYGNDGVTALTAYTAAAGEHPGVILGYGQGGTWAYFGPPSGPVANIGVFVPIDFNDKFGSFRIPNARQLSTYLNGRFYDPVYYAPKDTGPIAAVEPFFDHPDEFPGDTSPNPPLWSSYCMSPAAMFSPDVLGRSPTGLYYTNPWTLDAGFRSPAMSQASYPDLKTHMNEHHWLQNRKKECNPAFGTTGTYNGCEPFYFNHSWDSNPVTLFYDGHIENAGQRDAMSANSRVNTQSGHGLWSIDTPMQGGYADYSNGGYFMEAGLDWSSTSYHILTIDGIRGRDFTGN